LDWTNLHERRCGKEQKAALNAEEGKYGAHTRTAELTYAMNALRGVPHALIKNMANYKPIPQAVNKVTA